jgi:hypothetical protein
VIEVWTGTGLSLRRAGSYFHVRRESSAACCSSGEPELTRLIGCYPQESVKNASYPLMCRHQHP